MPTNNQEVEQLYKEIDERRKKINEFKLAQPKEEVKDYTLTKRNGDSIKLSDLFGDSDELLVIHNMGKSCVYCTMWADGFRGFDDVISDRMPFVLVSPDQFKVLDEFASSRNWNYNAVSADGSSFIKDLGFAYDKEGRTWYQPGTSALIRENGKIYRTAWDFFGPGDSYCSPWHFFELFPNGVNGWQPKYKYR